MSMIIDNYRDVDDYRCFGTQVLIGQLFSLALPQFDPRTQLQYGTCKCMV
jgi:hypothetical protein